MDSNTHSAQPPEPLGHPELLGPLERPEPPELPERLRWLADRLEGQWLKELAAVDALGAAATDQEAPAPSTASWLRQRLRMGGGAAHDAVRTARALFCGPLPGTADALVRGQLSPAHARVLANGTRQLPN